MFKKVLAGLLLSLMLVFGIGCATTPIIPDACKDAYVYKYKIYPDVTTAIEGAAVVVLAGVKDSAEPMIIACQTARKYIGMGSLKMALIDITAIFSKDTKYAPAALFAVTTLQDRFKDVILTDCDKEVLCAMFTRIEGYAKASLPPAQSSK